MRRFIILIIVLQSIVGSLVGLAHAEQPATGTSDFQTECQNAPGADGDQTRGSCDVCSHGLVNGFVVESDSNFQVLAPSKPIPVEQSAAKSWRDEPADEPPK